MCMGCPGVRVCVGPMRIHTRRNGERAGKRHKGEGSGTCVRPLPTPGPSARRKPRRTPGGCSGCEWRWPTYMTACSTK
eukprot:2404209-Pleurochrysis_carterae.AAC.1